MANEITVIQPKTLVEAQELARMLAVAQTMPQALQKAPADVLAVMMTGAELGFGPMQSIRAIAIIKGRPTLYADAMSALVQGRREVCLFFRCVETTDKAATFETHRAGHPEPTRLSYTMQDAATAGLSGQENYRKHPKQMLRARAISALSRLVYPDLVMGFYTPEEAEEMPAEIDVTPKPSAAEAVRARLEKAGFSPPPLASPPRDAEYGHLMPPAQEEPPPPAEYDGPPMDAAPAPSPPKTVPKRRMVAPPTASEAPRTSSHPQAPPMSSEASVVRLPNFGKWKGQTIGEVPDEALAYYSEAANRSLENPSKAQWHAKERTLLAALEAEMAKRGGASEIPF